MLYQQGMAFTETIDESLFFLELNYTKRQK